jgi:hypothetical protein
MRIINPSFGLVPPSTEKKASGPVDWRKDPIVLFSNSKPNAKELLEGIKAKLGTIRPIDNIDFVYKPSASQPAATAQYEEVAKKYRIALLAIAD